MNLFKSTKPASSSPRPPAPQKRSSGGGIGKFLGKAQAPPPPPARKKKPAAKGMEAFLGGGPQKKARRAPAEVIDVDAPIPKKKTMAPKKQATMTSFFGSKKKDDANGSKFPGWGKAKPAEEDDPTLDDLRAKARAAQENTANDEAIARAASGKERGKAAAAGKGKAQGKQGKGKKGKGGR